MIHSHSSTVAWSHTVAAMFWLSDYLNLIIGSGLNHEDIVGSSGTRLHLQSIWTIANNPWGKTAKLRTFSKKEMAASSEGRSIKIQEQETSSRAFLIFEHQSETFEIFYPPRHLCQGKPGNGKRRVVHVDLPVRDEEEAVVSQCTSLFQDVSQQVFIQTSPVKIEISPLPMIML